MSPVRLVFLLTACTALAAPLASRAEPTSTTVAGGCTTKMTLTERRVNEHAGAGVSELVSYVHLTQPIFQITVDEAVAMVDAQRARQAQCAVVSSR